MFHRSRLWAAIAALPAALLGHSLALVAPPAAAQASDFRYISTPISRPNFFSVLGRGLNDAGVVVGVATDNNLNESAFIFNGDSFTLFRVGSQPTFAAAINTAGAWAGSTREPGTDLLRAFVRTGGNTFFLPGMGNDDSFATAINASGQVAGNLLNSPNQTLPFLWNGQSTQFLPRLSSFSASTTAINDAGVVVGRSTLADGVTRATLWQNGTVVNLGSLGGNSSQALDINNRGVVVGSANLSENGPAEAFIWSGGQMRSLGRLDRSSTAVAINDFNLVVGSSADDNLNGTAVVAGAQGMHDLNDWLAVAATGSQRLTVAVDVNRHGQILARTQGFTSVLLTPQGTLRWAATGDGSFTDGGAWNSGVGQGPSRFLDMVLAHPSSQTVELSEAAEVRSLVVGAAGGPAAGQMRLRLSAGAVLTSTNTIVVERSGTLTGDGVIAADLQLAGTLQVGCGFSNCSANTRLYQDNRYTFNVAQGGLVTGSGSLEAGLSVMTGGEVRAGAGQVLRLGSAGSQHTSNGVLEVLAGGEVRVAGNWQNRLGTVRIDGGTVRFADGLDNRSQVHIGFGGASVHGRVNNAEGARIIASGGNQTTFWDAVTNNGELRASAGSQLVYFGPVNGAGSFTTNGTGAYHRFEGGFAPGNSPADVVLGETQLASTLTMELGGTTPGTQHDRITFTGLLTLDAGAQLEVVLIDGFVPQVGQVFDLFVFQAGVAGSFDALRLPGLSDGWVWDTSALYTEGDLRVAVVPEPATWLSLGAGLLVLVARRRWGARADAAVQSRAGPGR